MEQLTSLIDRIKILLLQSLINVEIAIGILLLFILLSGPIAYILVKIFNFREKDKKKIKANGFYKPLKIFVILLGAYLGVLVINLPEKINAGIMVAFKICTIILVAHGAANLLNVNSESYEKLKQKLKISTNDTAIYFMSRIIKAIVYVTAGFMIISELGQDLGGLITGLGVSSVVIALAAQDFARNIFAGFSILTDKPFQIGDYVETKEYSGTILDITFRSTRLRDVQNQVVIIPNSKIMESYIINSSKKEKRRFSLTFTLVLNTPLEKVAELNTKLRNALNAHPDIIKDTIDVAFNNISINGIDILINCDADIIDYNLYMNFREELNYTILGIIQEENIKLAYQSQTLYVKNAE